MKRRIVLFLALSFTFMGVNAQQQKDEIQLIQAMWGIEKREIVTKYMNLTPTENTAFWPVYDEFQNELKKFGAERIQLISDYANSLDKMDDVKADGLAASFFKNNSAIEKAMESNFTKMKKAIGSKRAFSYMQLEYYMQTKIRSEIQDNIPMIGELEKTAK